jgi:uncharacterized protein YecT (DUF1311 family)
MVEMNLGDPLDVPEDDWVAPEDLPPLPAEAVKEEPEVAASKTPRRELRSEVHEPPLSLGERPAPPAEPLEADPLRLAREPQARAGKPARPQRRAKAERAPAPPRRALWLTVGFALGMAAEAGLAWWMGVGGHPPRPVAVAQAAPVAVAPRPAVAAAPTLPPAPAPVAPIPDETTLAAEGATDPAAGPTAAPPTEAPENTAPAAVKPTPKLAKAAPEAAKELPDETAEAAAGPTPEPKHLAAAGPKGCAGQPTPADRTICADPHLQKLQRDLRAAYAEALDAHQDRDLLRQHQLAWSDTRASVSDPEQLAKVYEARIRKLKAATAAARAER